MKFEEDLQHLSEIAAKLEAGGLSLEEAVLLYGEGTKLAAECRRELDNAKLTVETFERNSVSTFANTAEDGSKAEL